MMISIFDTTICDNNLGNQIIMDSVNKYLRDIFPTPFFIRLPYLDNIGSEAIRYIKQSNFIFLGGTNALSSEMENYKQLGIDHTNYEHIQNIILMGIGWWQYQGDISPYTQKILKHCLHPNLYHSVRDSYAKDKLSTIGINNVLCTGCPTLWKLTEEHCKKIKKNKSENVLLTFTNYSQDKSDLELFKILERNYKDIFVWVQGPEDLVYARSFGKKINILPPNLSSLDELLASNIDLDYIGTRLHAGIRAMQFGRRSIIIGVDNRAIEKQKDFNLPVVTRHDLDSLEDKINSEFETRLSIPFDKIKQWLGQFQRDNNIVKDDLFYKGKKQFFIKPVSNVFGFDRGTPIDRYYIENFLNINKQFIQGHVLEIGDNTYTKKLDTGVTKSDVLNAVQSSKATIVGDLATGENIPDSAFDCIILTQTLQCIYDFKSGLKNAVNALKPGGTLLLTAPGICQISRYDMDRWGDFWRFTDKSMKLLLSEFVPEDSVSVESFGNVGVAKAFLDGLAVHELSQEILDYRDNDYQVTLTVIVHKPLVKHTADSVFTQRIETQRPLAFPLILLYHRIDNDPLDAQLLAVSPENFEAHLKRLAENCKTLPLHQFLAEVSRGIIRPNTMVITFDDGYLDNLTNAVPLLEKYGLHATIFVTSGMVGSDREFWWDALERIFFETRLLPSDLTINHPQGTHTWDLSTPQGRLKAYDEISANLRQRPVAEIAQFVDGLLTWAGLSQIGRSSHRVVNIEQLRQLAASPSIEIGSHTVSHSRLSALPPDQQRQEIFQSKQQLEAIINQPVRLFSYPFGAGGDFTDETVQIVGEAGYEAGIANIQGNITSPVDLYAIPRRLVRNWTKEEFTGWLASENKQELEIQTLSARPQKLINYQSDLR